MKYIVIQGDGMADRPVLALKGRTPLQEAQTPWFDFLAENGRNGLLKTIPEGFPAGSEVGNLSILGYDVRECFEGRGPLEAASLGYDMKVNDLAMRCNIIAVDEEGKIINHHGENLTTAEGSELISFLKDNLLKKVPEAKGKVNFYPGLFYRHLLVIEGGKKGMNLFPPHDNVGENTSVLIKKMNESAKGKPEEPTAELLARLIINSRELLESHPINLERKKQGKPMANMIWPWSEGYKPKMDPLTSLFPQIKSGVMITAVDLLRGIGRLAGLKNVEVEGATGLADTNYEGKAAAAIEALRDNDFVFVHVEATDEASHDRDLDLKLTTIQYLDNRIVGPLVKAVLEMEQPVRIALLPDHPTSVESGKHLDDAVPFVIFERDGVKDSVKKFDEISARNGVFGVLEATDFIKVFLNS